MHKTFLYFVLFEALFWTDVHAVKFCRISSDCVGGKQCCEGLCLSRTACNGLCSSDLDCDKDYGESCILEKCSCVRPPCTQETINQNTIKKCIYDSQCYKNQTCKDGECRSLDSISQTRAMNPAVLGVVATIGLIIFVGTFYLCLRNQRSSRPSLAAKQAHHLNQAMDGRINAKQNSALKTNATVENGNTQANEHHKNGKRRYDIKDRHKKTPIAGGSSLIELSVVEEEDELSEIASN